MQRCQYCGQLNDDLEEACIFCGEPLYIKVNHDEDYTYNSTNNDYEHRYAIQVAQELLDEEENRNKKRNHKPQSLDDLDDFAKELLSPENSSQELTEALFDTVYDDVNQEKDTSRKEEIIPEKPEETTVKKTIMEKEDNPDRDEPEAEDKLDLDEDDADLFSDIEPYEQENIQIIEDKLKRKIKRNKKLEIRLGLSIKNIDLSVDQITRQLQITGDVSINHLLDFHQNLKISLIFFDDHNQQINRANCILSMDAIKTYYKFIIESGIDLDIVSTIIILPEITNQQATIKPKAKKPENTANTKKSMNESVKSKPSVNKSSKSKVNTKKNTERVIKPKVDNTNSIFIENMKDIERKIGLDITNTSILTKDDSSIAIVGEIYIKNPDKYSSINIVATCYDSDNNIIATETAHINTKLYLGFDTLNIQISNIDIGRINRIRLYPTFQ